MKIAIILPSPFQGGVLRSIVNVTRMLVLGAKGAEEPLEVSFGYPIDMQFDFDTIETLRHLGVIIRPFHQQSIDREQLKAYYNNFISIQDETDFNQFLVFNDGVSNFEEADFLLIVSDHIRAGIPPHKKYGMLIYDYVQKYHPEILSDDEWAAFAVRAQVTCAATFVVTTTHQTRRDAISYAGVRPERAFVLPIDFDIPSTLKDRRTIQDEILATRDLRDSEYIMWPTIISGHENHLTVLDGLEHFLRRNDTMRVVLTGFHTKSFDPRNEKPSIRHPYIDRIRSKIGRSSILGDRILFEDFVEDQEFWGLMHHAACVLHSSTGDNGSYTVLEAAWLGVPAVSSRYPAMEEVVESFGLCPSWFAANNPKALSEALEETLRNRTDLKKRLPSHAVLTQRRYDHLAPHYWKEFSSILSNTGAWSRK